MITFSKTTFQETKADYAIYTAGLRLVDTFWEWYILDAAIYDILSEGQIIGHFSIHSEQNLLSSFFVEDAHMTEAEGAFAEMLEAFSPDCGFVATNDERLLSLCMDRLSSMGKHLPIELQAYFFDDSNRKVAQPAYPAGWLQLATDDDLPDLIKEDFFHPLYINHEENLIYVMRDADGTYMGAGHIQRMQLNRTWGAVGMVVAPEFRQKGVGRSIILHLKEITKQKGLTPIAGCWYYNENSKKTLESCGFQSRTRLLKVFFTPTEELSEDAPRQLVLE